MKKTFLAVLAAAAALFAVRAEEDGGASAAAPTGAAWQASEAAAIESATRADALDAYTESVDAAAELLAAVRPAYGTDPLKAVQIAAVTQSVTDPAAGKWSDFFAFWRKTQADRRRIWSEALLDAAEKAEDDDVATFVLDQLRWCGFGRQADRVLNVGAVRGGRCAEFAAMVADELRGAQSAR